MNRVVLVGEVATGGLTCALTSAFKAVGWNPSVVSLEENPRSILTRLGYRSPVVARVRRRELSRRLEDIFRSAKNSAAALIVVVKGPFIDSRLVDRMRRASAAPVICWNPDSPFDSAVSNRGAGIPAAVGAYDAYVTWSADIADLLRERGATSIVIPFGWDRSSFFPEFEQDGDPKVRASRPVFVGTATAERVRWIQTIREYRPIVFGNDWPSIRGVEIREAIYGRRLRIALTRAPVVLNFLRPQNSLSHNMRTFEIPGCGGHEIAEWSPDHEAILAPHGVPLFDSASSLVQVLDESLSHPQPGLEGTPAWLERHSYERRVETLLRYLDLPLATSSEIDGPPRVEGKNEPQF